MSAHVFDEAIALRLQEPGEYEGSTHAAYGNMVGPFGGITASTMLNAACLHPQRLGDPLALTVNFAGPVADGDFHLGAMPVRTNRSTQHWLITLSQGDEVAATASAVFGTRRDTWAATEMPRPAPPSADGIEPMPSPARVAWTDRYEMRFVSGAWPDFAHPEEQADSLTELWIHDQPPRPLDVLSLAAICDAFYPRVFRRHGRFVPAGTVSITTYFHADAVTLAAQGTRSVLGRARGQRFGQGLFDQAAEVWSDDGQLLANSHQIVYFKD